VPENERALVEWLGVVALFEFGVPCLFGLLMPIDPRQENVSTMLCIRVLGLGTELGVPGMGVPDRCGICRCQTSIAATARVRAGLTQPLHISQNGLQPSG